VSVAGVVTHTVPAKLIFALEAGHVGTPTALLNHHSAVRAGLRDQQLAEIGRQSLPRPVQSFELGDEASATCDLLQWVAPLCQTLRAQQRLFTFDMLCVNVDQDGASVATFGIWASAHILAVNHIVFQLQATELDGPFIDLFGFLVAQVPLPIFIIDVHVDDLADRETLACLFLIGKVLKPVELNLLRVALLERVWLRAFPGWDLALHLIVNLR